MEIDLSGEQAQEIYKLRKSAEEKVMVGDVMGAYTDLKRAARMNPSDKLVWGEYSKATARAHQYLRKRREREQYLKEKSSPDTDFIRISPTEESYAHAPFLRRADSFWDPAADDKSFLETRTARTMRLAMFNPDSAPEDGTRCGSHFQRMLSSRVIFSPYLTWYATLAVVIFVKRIRHALPTFFFFGTAVALLKIFNWRLTIKLTDSLKCCCAYLLIVTMVVYWYSYYEHLA